MDDVAVLINISNLMQFNWIPILDREHKFGWWLVQNELPFASAGGPEGKPPPEGSGNSFCAQLKQKAAEIHLINLQSLFLKELNSASLLKKRIVMQRTTHNSASSRFRTSPKLNFTRA